MSNEQQKTREALDWPEGAKFTFADEPGEHDPCYVVMPSGNSLPVNHHNTPGVDIARAKFIVDACNEKLAGAASVDRAGIVATTEPLFVKLEYAARYARGSFRTADEVDFWCSKVEEHAKEIQALLAEYRGEGK